MVTAHAPEADVVPGCLDQPLLADSVEKLDVAAGSACTKARISEHCYFSGFNRVQMPGFLVDPVDFASCRRSYPVNWWRLRGQFGQPPQILYGGSQGEFVARAAESA